MSAPCLVAKISSILVFFWLAAIASAHMTEAVVRIGPGSYENITAEVKRLKLHELGPQRLRREMPRKKVGKEKWKFEKTKINANNKFETCCGVFVCDTAGFKGNCYWECYPEDHEIYPNGWWVKNVVSFGPDPGVKAYLSHGECTIRGPFDKIEYPGKDLGKGLRNDLGCFYVAYQPHVG
ncbi:hypothetical protein CPLU01_15734 [Colletotrichum plurivorum]|uniref:Uncharacterized protein n=1 Tax=Colletotrichum plurivorum TaxID=2175906 RepID=A0A8H6J8H6_9PEZI|nr:hypothetical protein CPLU01_15734 [Colletotrichum plurivorum]